MCVGCCDYLLLDWPGVRFGGIGRFFEDIVMAHIIKLSWNGLQGTAESENIHGSFSEIGRSQAEALSRILAAMAKVKELNGSEYQVPGCGLRGNIGETTKRRRRKSISDMDTFELVGGVMHDPRQ